MKEILTADAGRGLFCRDVAHLVLTLLVAFIAASCRALPCLVSALGSAACLLLHTKTAFDQWNVIYSPFDKAFVLLFIFLRQTSPLCYTTGLDTERERYLPWNTEVSDVELNNNLTSRRFWVMTWAIILITKLFWSFLCLWPILISIQSCPFLL